MSEYGQRRIPCDSERQRQREWTCLHQSHLHISQSKQAVADLSESAAARPLVQDVGIRVSGFRVRVSGFQSSGFGGGLAFSVFFGANWRWLVVPNGTGGLGGSGSRGGAGGGMNGGGGAAARA